VAVDFNLSEYLTLCRKQINAALSGLLPADTDDSPILASMRYATLGNGKRLRPVLCMAAAEAVGGSAENVLMPACALELIHTYSLIHDDLPAMDDDRLRRGRPTCHVAFDEATAILAGDALLTLAFDVLAENVIPADAAVRLQVIRCIAGAAGYQGMIAGQMADIDGEGRRLDADALKALHAAKTGALIRAAVETGARLAGGDASAMIRLVDYAGHIGLAFQVTDDILNVEGDPDRMGKAVGTDAARGKNTYPALLGLDAAKTLAENKVHRALQALAEFDHRADPLRAIAKYIIHRTR